VHHINPLNAELNPICHLLALLGTHIILHVSRIRVNILLHIIPARYTIHRVYFYLTMLYMFRALLSPIVRSTKVCLRMCKFCGHSTRLWYCESLRCLQLDNLTLRLIQNSTNYKFGILCPNYGRTPLIQMLAIWIGSALRVNIFLLHHFMA
jgi:hypothetical protein